MLTKKERKAIKSLVGRGFSSSKVSLKGKVLPRLREHLIGENLVLANKGEGNRMRLKPRDRSKKEQGTWLHVMNLDIEDGWLDNLMDLKGEICASRDGDDLHHNRGTLIAVEMSGPAYHVSNRDCWSQICPVTGYRWSYGRMGACRTEAWIVPYECNVECIVTDSTNIEYLCLLAGYEVRLVEKKKPRDPWWQSEPKREISSKAQRLMSEEGW